MLTIREIRDRVAAQLGAHLVGWRESAYPLELMPYDARPTQHQAWAVSMGRTEAARPDRQSRRGGEDAATQARTAVRVGWSWWLRPDAYASDYAAALTGEADVIAALGGTEADPGLYLLFTGADRRVSNAEGGALFLGTIDVEIHHRLALEAPR